VLYEFQAVKPCRSLNQEITRTLSITKHLLIESSQNDIINVHRSLLLLLVYLALHGIF